MPGIQLAYGECQCLMPYEKRMILESLQELIEKREKVIRETKERRKIDKLEQAKGELVTVKARVGFTPECK